MPTPLPISAVNHLGVTTRHLDQSKAFYRDVLGFREVSRPNFNFRGAWLYNYGLMIHLIESQSAGERTAEIQTRDNHLALHADDLAAVERLLSEHDIPFRKNEIKDRAIKQIFFQDPDGHHIEIGAYPPTPPFV
jgi:catechol 2,3-dioxygenase-like lactoylglutathione lyase family enzyme